VSIRPPLLIPEINAKAKRPGRGARTCSRLWRWASLISASISQLV